MAELYLAFNHFKTIFKLSNKKESISMDFAGPLPQEKEFLDKYKTRNLRKR